LPSLRARTLSGLIAGAAIVRPGPPPVFPARRSYLSLDSTAFQSMFLKKASM